MDPRDDASPRTVSTGALARRMLAGVIAAVIGLALVYRLAAALPWVEETIALIAAAMVALLIMTAAVIVLLRPLVRRQAELQVRYEAALADSLRDPLTGLGNHRAFQEELDRQSEEALRYGIPVSLMLLDLDEFKSINDSRGHAGGDRALRDFGRILSTSIRRADRAFRIGGDEFAVLLPHTDAEGARIVARRVLAIALQPVIPAGESQPVSFSAGISALPQLAEGRARLYAQADAALYAAKRGGRTDITVFDPSTESDAPSTAGASQAIAEVVARGQLQPVYQPIVDLATRRVVGVEGLIRPVPPAPFASPAELFAAAEASGRLTALDLACIEAIVAGARDLAPDQFLSLNLAPPTVEAPEFSAAALLGILAREGFPPSRVIVELTEQQTIHDLERVRSRLEMCRRAGIRFAADDVGAGNAGLRLLAEISFDILKVDLSLVQRSAAGGLSTAVLGSVVALAGRTGAQLIAEGIEELEQVPQLREMGITMGQGYALGRPGPLDTIAPPPELLPTANASWRESIGLPVS